MRVREHIRARRKIENWQHFFRVRKTLLPPEQRTLTKIYLREGTIVNARVGTADLTAIKGVFLDRPFQGVRPSYGVVVDVGAHIGCFTLRVAGKADRILAIEPAPDNFELLELNLEENNITNTVPICCALSDTEGQHVLCYNESHSDSHTIEPRSNRTGGVRDIAVPSKTLSSIMAEHQIDRIDLLKLDCEGSEHGILCALDRAEASRIGEIYMEYHDLENPRRDFTSLDAHLQSVGFRRVWERIGRGRGYAHYIHPAWTKGAI